MEGSQQQHQQLVYSNDESLQKVYVALLDSFIELSDLLRYRSNGRKEAGSTNLFGDVQLECDVHCDEIIFEKLKSTGEVSYGLSEEQPKPIALGGSKFIVTFDPLDGSSIIGTNWTVGSIFGIWPSDDNLLIGAHTRDQIVSGCCMYGPRTTVILYNQKENAVQELTLLCKRKYLSASQESMNIPQKTDCLFQENEQKQLHWVVTHDKFTIKPNGKIFAPGNLRASTENIKYREVIDFWMNEGYTLRYTGGMVPDIYQIFIKGAGIFATVGSKSYPAKLRVLYEVAPMAHLVVKAGGKSSDGKISLMDLEVTSHDQRSGIIVGSFAEVDRVVATLNA